MFRTRNYSMPNLFLSLNYFSLLSFSLMVNASSSFVLKGLLFWYRRTHATQPCQTDKMIIIRLFLELLNDFYTGYKSIFLFQHIFWGWPFTHSPTDYNKWLLESIQLLVFLGMVIRNRLCLTIFAHRVYGERILYTYVILWPADKKSQLPYPPVFRISSPSSVRSKPKSLVS